MHDDDLAEVLGKKPVVLLFATPALCQSRVCGPVVDIAEQVKRDRGDEAAFIHMEIYNDNPANEGLRPQVQAYGLPTEPWLFVDRLRRQGSTPGSRARSASPSSSRPRSTSVAASRLDPPPVGEVERPPDES